MATSAADPQGQEGHSLTRAGEDYLESIYRLSLESAEGDKSVRSVDVAEQLEVSKASVNKALSQLKEMGMVVQGGPYRGGRGLCQGGLALPQGAAHLPGA